MGRCCKIVLMVVVSTTLLTALPMPAAPNWSILNGAIVRVQVVGKQTGTGIVISALPQEIRIVTAKHVVEGGGTIQVYFNSDPNLPFKAFALQEASDALDLAVLKVEQSADMPLPTNIPRIAPREGAFLNVGDAVWTVDFAWRPAPNTVLKLNHDVDPSQFEYTKGAVSDGFSGGPIFDNDGMLVGIHRGGVEGVFAVGVKWASAAEVLKVLNSEPRNVGRIVKPDPIDEAMERAKRVREELNLPAGTKRTNPKDSLVYVRIPGGQFQMGCSPADNQCDPDERPSHPVRLGAFWLGESEVTQKAYKRITGKDVPDIFQQGETLPVEAVSRADAQKYCSLVGRGRLPTEAEWEFAARAGSTEPRYGVVDAIGWYEGNSGGNLHPVKGKSPNAWGLYDMLGSVWEWVNDGYGKYSTSKSTIANPKGPSSQKSGVLRGGAYNESPATLRASMRTDGSIKGFAETLAGFRCAFDVLP